MEQQPPEPTPQEPPQDWPHLDLYHRVIDALESLPFHFSTETYIEGLLATDIFTLNMTLGATIESQVVASLNQIRDTWDPDDNYALYGFVRQPQTFPDVLLRRPTRGADTDDSIIMGIELKGWYLLSKEGEPSFRYTVTPDACAPQDLLVCVPWTLKNVLSGSPTVFSPYIKPARYAAELRNFYWQHQRTTTTDTTIHFPSAPVTTYPSKSDQISDRPESDRGRNFGRYARTGLMDNYKDETLARLLCGIPASAWLDFLKIFTESADTATTTDRIDRLRRRLQPPAQNGDADANIYLRILDLLEGEIG